MSSSCQDQANGSFSCRLWAPNRPPRWANSATGGIGALLMISGDASWLASANQTSLG